MNFSAKKYFIAGTLVFLPLLITVYILVNLFRFADNILGQFVNNYLIRVLGFYIPGLGLILFLIIIFSVGVLTSHFLGKKFGLLLDSAFRRFPLIRLIYPSIKQITEFLFTTQRHSFKKAVLVEYPRIGIWALGFITNEGFPEAKDKTKEELLSVFLPSSPGPLTGFFVLIPRQQVIILDIPIEDAIKLLVSGGLLNPPLPFKKS